MAQSKQTWPSDEDQKTIGYIVHSIKMGDVEDPDLFVANPIYEWQQTKAGKYIMKNSAPAPIWHRTVHTHSYGYLYTITAYLTPKQLTYYKLRFE